MENYCISTYIKAENSHFTLRNSNHDHDCRSYNVKCLRLHYKLHAASSAHLGKDMSADVLHDVQEMEDE